MHVIIATDGSRQALAAARHLKSFADPAKISTITVLAVIRPYAAVAFADDLAPARRHDPDLASLSFRDAAESATRVVAAELEGWGPKIQTRVRSGSPANEIIKAAKQADAGLVVMAAGSRGLSDTVLLGSTAQRVQHSAPCPVLVVRPQARSRKKSPAKK